MIKKTNTIKLIITLQYNIYGYISKKITERRIAILFKPNRLQPNLKNKHRLEVGVE